MIVIELKWLASLREPHKGVILQSATGEELRWRTRSGLLQE